MNVYFLVEGRRTEVKVYPKWLSYLVPQLAQTKDPFQISTSSYYLFNGNGFPSLLNNHLRSTVEDINSIKRFDFLVIVLDSDECTIQERSNEVFTFMQSNNIKLEGDCKLIVLVQHRCIETWLLGNKKVFKANPENKELCEYVKFYNVKEEDPELMNIYGKFGSHGQFHESYLSLMLAERNIRYTKKNPLGVTEKNYLDQLIDRSTEDKHIQSFTTLLDFCQYLKANIIVKSE